jgi:hypothetical protein
MPREQTPNLSAPSPIRPKATPVDTFEAPQAPPERQAPDPNNSLVQLSRALSSINPGLLSFVSERETAKKKEMTEQQKAEAQGIANSLAAKNQTDWNTLAKQLEKKSTDPSQSIESRLEAQNQLQQVRAKNPWTRQFYDQLQVSQLAAGLEQSIKTEWSTSPIKESDDLAALDAFLDERINAGLQTVQGRYDSKALAEEFYPKLQKIRDSVYTEHTNYRQKRVVEDTKDSLSVLTTTKVSGFTDSFNQKMLEATDRIGKLENVDTDAKMSELTKVRESIFTAWGNDLTMLGTDAVKKGLQGKEVNAILVEAIIAEASAKKEPKLLKLADYVKTGSGASLSKIADVQEKLTQARRSINSEKYTEIQQADALEERERKEFLRKAETELFDRLDKNPWSDVTDYKKQFFDRQMGDEYLEILKVQRKLQEDKENPVTKREDIGGVGTYVYNGGTDMAPVNQAYQRGKIDKGTFQDYGRTVSINKDRAERDAGLASLKKELTDSAIGYAKDKFKLNVKFGLDKESRIKSRNVQVEAEVRKSIDSYIRSQEAKNHSPSRDEINDYIYGPLMTRMEKQFNGSVSQSTSKPSGNSKPSTSTQPAKKTSPQSSSSSPKSNSNQEKIKKIQSDTRLSPATKKKLIDLLSK